MRNVATIGILIGALAVAVLPARADDHAIGLATGQLGGSAWPAQADNQQTRAASWQHVPVQTIGTASAGEQRGLCGICPRRRRRADLQP